LRLEVDFLVTKPPAGWKALHDLLGTLLFDQALSDLVQVVGEHA